MGHGSDGSYSALTAGQPRYSASLYVRKQPGRLRLR
jgi:hypothetical protein